MDTFANLERQLASFEGIQFAALCSSVAPASLTAAAVHGAIQNAVLEESTRPFTGRLPVVVAIGINYYHSNATPTFPQFSHWLPATANGLGVTEPIPAMRSAADLALQASKRNMVNWVQHGSAVGLLSSPCNYHLIAMNLSPFITRMHWGQLSVSTQNGILGAWPYANHLTSLLHLLGNKVDL